MKRFSSWIARSIILLGFACSPSSSQGPAGHWEGNIILPGVQLAIRVDLENDSQGWQGTIDIPAQGVRNFKLSGTAVQGSRVAFQMAGIPGEPKFSGKLGSGGKELSGDFSQGGQNFSFKLERKPKPAAVAIEETPEKGLPGKGLAGYWQASLKPMPSIELRLVLEITNAPEGQLGGILISLDQGNARVPMTTLTLETNLVSFETLSIRGSFDGDLSADGSAINGDWQQLGRVTPVTFFRLAKAPNSINP